MKKAALFTILFSLLLLSDINYAQEKSQPFEVKISGKGRQSIIFIPGFACSGEVWKETKALFEEKATCYTLTMAGFAGVAPQVNASFESWEKANAVYIKENKISKPVIVGHSMGGALAMALAADYPELISRIVVVDALPCLTALSNPAFVSKENNDCSAMIAQLTAATDEQFYQMQKMSMPRLLADTSKLTQVINWSIKSDRTTFGKMYCDFSNTDLRQKITRIQCPALVLLESYFVNIKAAIAEQFKNAITVDMRFATKGLHFIMYDDKNWYETQLKSFISL